MRRRTTILAVSVAAVLGAAGTAVLLTSGAASAATGYGVAPYVDLSANSSAMLDNAIQAGLKSYTAAFIIGSGCTPIWGDTLGINNSTANAKIARAEAAGAKTIIAFGGAAGSELAQSCTDPTALSNAYQSVIDKYHVDHLDFDVEGAAIADTGSVNRRFEAINTLERNNSGLVVSLTIPVTQTGPNANGTAFLQAAKTSGTRVDLVNIMTMDYGGPVADMGAAALSAAKGTLAVAQGLWPGFTYASLGITPMIGQNDQAGEIFTAANAQSLVQFANSNGVGRLAFWSLGRDGPCPAGAGGGASPNCSSVSQGALDFTRIFNSGNDGGGAPPPVPAATASSAAAPPAAIPASASRNGAAAPVNECGTAPWNATTAYTGGLLVSMNGHLYKANWWSQAEAPDTHSADDDPWTDLGACAGGAIPPGGAAAAVPPASPSPSLSPAAVPAVAGNATTWVANHAYTTGDRVSYNGHEYQCRLPHTSQLGWEPANAPALWQPLN